MRDRLQSIFDEVESIAIMAGGVDGVAESSVNFEVHCYSRATSAVFRLYHDSLGLIVASFPFVSSP